MDVILLRILASVLILAASIDLAARVFVWSLPAAYRLADFGVNPSAPIRAALLGGAGITAIIWGTAASPIGAMYVIAWIWT